MKLQMSFGENLINLRKQKGWSQDDLADNLNLSRQAISKWENETSKPDIDNIKKISKIFSVKIDDLLNNDVVKDKAVTLNVKKQEKKEKTITIVKCMIIAVIILYIINVIFKFASLLIIVNGIQKYANLSNYHYLITTYDENGLVEKEECWFKDEILNLENTINGEKSTTIIDFNNNIGSIFFNDKENSVEINMKEYNKAHQNYKNGKQLLDRMPETLQKSSILSMVYKLSYLNIVVCNSEIIIQTKYNYLVLDKKSLLPVMNYSNINKSYKFYTIEFC